MRDGTRCLTRPQVSLEGYDNLLSSSTPMSGSVSRVPSSLLLSGAAFQEPISGRNFTQATVQISAARSLKRHPIALGEFHEFGADGVERTVQQRFHEGP